MVFCVLHEFSTASGAYQAFPHASSDRQILFSHDYADPYDLSLQNGAYGDYRSNSLDSINSVNMADDERPFQARASFFDDFHEAPLDASHGLLDSRGGYLGNEHQHGYYEHQPPHLLQNLHIMPPRNEHQLGHYEHQPQEQQHLFQHLNIMPPIRNPVRNRDQASLGLDPEDDQNRDQASVGLDPEHDQDDRKDGVEDLTFALEQQSLRGHYYGAGRDYDSGYTGLITAPLRSLATTMFGSGVGTYDSYDEVDRCKALFVQQYALNLGVRSKLFDWYINIAEFKNTLKRAILKGMAQYADDEANGITFPDDPSSSLFAPEPKYRGYGYVERKMRYITCHTMGRNAYLNKYKRNRNKPDRVPSCDHAEIFHSEMRRQMCPYDCPAEGTRSCGLNKDIRQNDLFEESLDELQVYDLFQPQPAEPVEEEAEPAEPAAAAWRPRTKSTKSTKKRGA